MVEEDSGGAMHLQDARILALNGAMLADGEFRVTGLGPGELLCPQDSLISVRTGEDGSWPEFALIGNARRRADGFWDADWPTHSLRFERTMPNLDALLGYPSFGGADRTRYGFEGDGTSFGWIYLNAVHGTEPRPDSLRGRCGSLSIETVRDEGGLHFRVDADTDLLEQEGKTLPSVRISVDFRLPWCALAVRGSRLWHAGASRLWDAGRQGIRPSAGEPLVGGLTALTLDRYGGSPYFRGSLDLGQAQPAIYRGAWVSARLAERRLILRAQAEPRPQPDGFVQGNNYGPQLVLHNLGHETWKEMLSHSDEAELEQSGAGIGHVEGVTGRDAGEIGPHEQPITSLKVVMRRLPDGISITLRGELGAMRQKHHHSYQPLGPDFSADFFVPTEFLFARGWIFGQQWQERRRALADE